MTRDLDRDLASASGLALDRASALASVLARVSVSVLARASARARAHALASGLASGGDSAESVPEASHEDEWQPPGRGPRVMVAVATRVLPVGSRARYAEEVRDELGMLGRWAQLRYAAGFAARSWELRRSLGESAPAREP